MSSSSRRRRCPGATVFLSNPDVPGPEEQRSSAVAIRRRGGVPRRRSRVSISLPTYLSFVELPGNRIEARRG